MVSNMRICFDNDGNAYIAEEPYGVIKCQTKEDFERANEAIEKQIPKKAPYVDIRFRNHGRRISDGRSLSKCYKCPNCGSHIFHVFDDENHCVHCGQAIDWGEGGE